MSAERDSSEEPRAGARAADYSPASLPIVGQSEARRAVSQSQLAPDPERLAQGWERRFVADEVRAAEMVQLYRELGYETVVDPVRPQDVRQDCEECLLVTLQRLQIIYTRSRVGAHGA